MDPYRVASVADTAVDLEGMGRAAALKYAETRDPALLKVTLGKTVTWFTLRRVPTSLFNGFVMGGRAQYEQLSRAFMVGVEKVEALVDIEGQHRAVMEPTGEADTPRGKIRVWRDVEIDMIPPVFVEDIGNIVLTRSALDPKGEVSYQLPPISLLVFLKRVCPPADENLSDAPLSSDEAKEPPPHSSGDDGDGPTGAAVTESPT